MDLKKLLTTNLTDHISAESMERFVRTKNIAKLLSIGFMQAEGIADLIERAHEQGFTIQFRRPTLKQNIMLVCACGNGIPCSTFAKVEYFDDRSPAVSIIATRTVEEWVEI